MRGHHSSPLGWAATLLIAVAYAHVLLELAAAVLAAAVAVRMLVSPAQEALRMRASGCRLRGRSRCEAPAIDRGRAREPSAAVRRRSS